MGAWGIGAFENDDAMDWSLDLMDAADPLRAIQSALDLAEEEDYLEAPDACQILAACAVISASKNKEPTSGYPLPDELADWIFERDRDFGALAPVAVKAIQRVLAPDSELNELWEDTGDYDLWKQDVQMPVVSLTAQS